MNDRARKATNSYKHWHVKRGQDNPMRKLIYAINTTLDGCVMTTPNRLSMMKNLNILLTSRERLAYWSMGVKLIN